MTRALERAKAGEARVIPILVRKIDTWEGLPFANLSPLPQNAQAISLWKDQDEVGEEPWVLNEAVEALRAYSLLSCDPRKQTLTVHRLVQAILGDSMEASMAKEWKERVVLAVRAASPDVTDIEQRNACEQWLPHALLCAQWIEDEQIFRPESVSLLNRAGYYLNEYARYALAEPLYQCALAIFEQVLGPEHPSTKTVRKNYTILLKEMGHKTE